MKNAQLPWLFHHATYFIIVTIVLILYGCRDAPNKMVSQGVGVTLTKAMSQNGQYISWREHIIDDTEMSGISGSDGLSIGDIDNDGFMDVVSVHETDTEYTENAEGFIRIAFGTKDPKVWKSITLADGTEVGGAEDVTIVDLNGDGFLDVIGACEWAHLIYFENPGLDCRTEEWKRHIPSVTKDKGAFIRVFDADFNRDGRREIIAANKGISDGLIDIPEDQTFPISYFEINGNPLNDDSWTEHELIRVNVPINSQPIDLDLDGDEDIIAGSRGDGDIYILENISASKSNFRTHSVETSGSSLPGRSRAFINGFNMDFADFSGDGLLDIVLGEVVEPGHSLGTHLIWLEQPANLSDKWKVQNIGQTTPDELVGIRLADINNDGFKDVMTGGYSRGSRSEDGKSAPGQSLARMAWFEHPKDLSKPWIRHDISRRVRGMFDKFIAKDMDMDGDIDFISTRGNSVPFDGVFWLEQIRSDEPIGAFEPERSLDSREEILPN